MLGLKDAESEEHGRPSANFVVTAASCGLRGRLKVVIEDESIASGIFHEREIIEEYCCNYESNRAYQQRFQEAGLQISGWDEGGEARIVEIPEHPFFVATQFMPQLSSTAGRPHPFIVAYLRAVAAHGAQQAI